MTQAVRPSSLAGAAFGRRRSHAIRTARRGRVWQAALTMLVPATAITLVLAQTTFFIGDKVAEMARWVMLIALAFLFLVRPAGLKRRHLGIVDVFLVGFLALALASALYSSYPSLSLQRALSACVLYIAVFWTGWALADLVGGQRISDSLLKVAVATFIACIIVMPFTELAWLLGRFRGIMGNPNAVGMLGILFLPLGVSYLIRRKSLAALCMVGVIALCVVLSGSRNGVLAVSFATVFMLLRLHAWRPAMLLGVAGMILYLAMPSQGLDVARTSKSLGRLLTSDKVATGGGRIEAWQIAIPIVQNRLLLGHGFGTEEQIFKGMRFRIHRGRHVHNSYLGLAYQVGVVGAAMMFVPLIGFVGVRIVKRRVGSPEIAAYEAVLIGGLIASFFESWIYSVGNAFAFPFWMSFMLLVRAHVTGIDFLPQFAPAKKDRVTLLRAKPWHRALAPGPALGASAVRRFDPGSKGSVAAGGRG